MTGADYEGKFESTKDIPYLARYRDIRGVFGEDLSENWPCYYGTALYTRDKNLVIIVPADVLAFS